MSDFDFVIKKGDRLSVLTATLKDSAGNAVDLTGATVKLLMKEIGGAALKVNAAGTVDPDQVNNKGKVSYAWAAVDTDTPGTYEAEWEVTLSGKQQSFPNDSYLVIRILDDLD